MKTLREWIFFALFEMHMVVERVERLFCWSLFLLDAACGDPGPDYARMLAVFGGLGILSLLAILLAAFSSTLGQLVYMINVYLLVGLVFHFTESQTYGEGYLTG